MVFRVVLFIVPALAAIVLVGVAHGTPPGTTAFDQAKASGWDCSPEEPIFGYLHCAPPGKASVLEIVTGQASPAVLTVRVFNLDGSFAGIETLLRADLYGGQPCPQDNLAEWGLLDLPVDYRGCHNFDT